MRSSKPLRLTPEMTAFVRWVVDNFPDDVVPTCFDVVTPLGTVRTAAGLADRAAADAACARVRRWAAAAEVREVPDWAAIGRLYHAATGRGLPAPLPPPGGKMI